MSIIVFIEHIDGKLKKQSAELVSYAVQMAGAGSQKVIAVAAGNIERNELESLSSFGANRIIHIKGESVPVHDNQVYTRILADLFMKEQAQILVMANSFTGKALAPRLAIRLEAGLAAGVVELPESMDPFRVKKKIYNGKAFAFIELTSTHKILTLNSNACTLQEKATEVEWEEFTPHGDYPTAKTQILEVSKNTSGSLLTEASIVVSGGRGMRTPENWGPLEELASCLDAALACSKPVSDEGWRPHEEHVGQTGKTIAPDLYIAVGISGAVQHLAGVSSSKTIVAINTDKEAPVFEIADYGIVGDAKEILPKLIQSVKKLQTS